jgi:hypothetical protein
MSDLTMTYRITVPDYQDPDEFVTFMREEYLPAVDKKATRKGKVSSLELLQGDQTDTTREFIWLVSVSGMMGNPIIDEAAQQKFDSMGAKIATYVTVAAWPETP